MSRTEDWALGIWAVLGALLALSYRLAQERLWMMAAVPAMGWGLVGLVFLVAVLHDVREPVSRARALRRAGVIGATLLLFPLVAALGEELTQHIRFAWNHSSHDRIVEHARLQKADGSIAHQDGLDYLVDPGPPVRVAFLWPGGIIDNWCGVVHDPTGQVMTVNDLTPGSPEWRQNGVTRLFGGDMTTCRQLDARHYLCCFT